MNVVSIKLYSYENPANCVLSIKLNTEQSIDECHDILLNLFPTLKQRLSAPAKRIHNDDVKM